MIGARTDSLSPIAFNKIVNADDDIRRLGGANAGAGHEAIQSIWRRSIQRLQYPSPLCFHRQICGDVDVRSVFSSGPSGNVDDIVSLSLQLSADCRADAG